MEATIPFNGSGTFDRLFSWTNDAAAGIPISSSRMDTETDGMAAGLSNCITRDGQGKPTAAIDWNGQNLANVGALGVVGNATLAGTLGVTGAATFGGNVTLGDASGDSVTINAGTVSIPNGVNFSGGNALFNTASNPNNSRFACANGNATQRWGFGTIGNNAPFYVLNDAAVGVQLTNGSTSWASSSDESLKDIIEPIAEASAKVASLRAIIGKYKTDEEGVRRSFLIAQDVQAVLPEAVAVDEVDGTLVLRYTEVIPLLVAALKEHAADIAALKARLAAAGI